MDVFMKIRETRSKPRQLIIRRKKKKNKQFNNVKSAVNLRINQSIRFKGYAQVKEVELKRRMDIKKDNTRFNQERYLRNHRKTSRVVHKHQIKEKKEKEEEDYKKHNKNQIKLGQSSSMPNFHQFDGKHMAKIKSPETKALYNILDKLNTL
mmetsp:Transcript_22516/g.19997  ORF Transcript_22516/g.19997 Transcript_22516/m.19997 type:complete len:151 (-) Transcript_22516:974-1426(-)